jgi:serine/threonine protein kinase
MKYELTKELSSLSLVIKSEQEKKLIFDRLEFPVQLRDSFRLELQKGFKEVARQTAEINSDGLLRYRSLEKYNEQFYLVREGSAKIGIEPFQTVSPEQTGRVLLQIIQILQDYHQKGLLLGGFSLGQLKQDQNGSFYLQDPCVINYLSKSLGDEYKVDAPPEVIKGQTWDKPADLFSWGVLAYRLLTDQDPFLAATPSERLDKILKLGVLSPKDIKPELSNRLNLLIIRCISSDPQKRPSLDELKAELTYLLEEDNLIVDDNEVREYQEKALANRRRYQTKERFRLWFRKYGIATTITFAAIAFFILTWVGSQSKPLITAKDKPSKVLACYFKGVQNLDVTLVDQTLHKAKNSFSDMVTNLYVINKTQQGMTYSIKNNIKLDYLELKIQPLAHSRQQVKYKANYTLRVALTNQIQYIKREDTVILQPIRKVWRITQIVVSKEKRWSTKFVNPEAQTQKEGLTSPTPMETNDNKLKRH